MTDLDHDDEHDIRFSVRIKSYGQKPALVRSIGKALCRELYLQFGSRLTVTDHRGRVITFNPNEHDWGLGDNATSATENDPVTAP